MRRFVRLFWLQFKLYATDQYFLWLTVGSTTAIFWLQYLSAYAANNLGDNRVWLRIGVYGLWASATTAVGSIGFQRYQGTLPYLVNARLDARIVLLSVIVPAASFGLLAFPLAYLWALILGVAHTGITWGLVGTVSWLWAAAVLMDALIAAFFVLSPYALVYEDLVMVPILLLAGLFGQLPGWAPVLTVGRWLIPIATPLTALLETGRPDWWAAGFSGALWAGLTWTLARYLLHRASLTGQLGVL